MYILLLWAIIIVLYIFNEKNPLKRLPPGPLPLPLIGNLHKLGDQPHLTLYQLYQKYGNIFRLRMGAVETVVFTEPDTLHEAFVANQSLFVDRFQRESRMLWNNGQNIVNANGEYHKMIKSIAMQGISSNSIKKMEDDITEEIQLLCQQFDRYAQSGEPVDPINLIKICSMNIIFRFLFSHHFPYDLEGQAGEIVTLINHCFHLAGAKIPDDFIPLMKRLRRSRSSLMTDYIKTNIKVCNYIESLIKERLTTFNKHSKPKDILDHYLIEHEKNNIPFEGIVYSFADLVAAGTDSSANTVSALIKAMANRPKLQELMYYEIQDVIKNEPGLSDKANTTFTNAVIKETIRRFPTAPLGVPHAATEDCEFRGYHIKKGTQIFLNIYSTFMSPKCWKDPEEFDPSRFMGEDAATNSKIVRYIFGVGPRNCLGLALAEQELFLITSTIFKRFKFECLTEEMMNEDMLFGLAFVPTPFKVRITRRPLTSQPAES